MCCHYLESPPPCPVSVRGNALGLERPGAKYRCTVGGSPWTLGVRPRPWGGRLPPGEPRVQRRELAMGPEETMALLLSSGLPRAEQSEPPACQADGSEVVAASFHNLFNGYEKNKIVVFIWLATGRTARASCGTGVVAARYTFNFLHRL